VTAEVWQPLSPTPLTGAAGLLSPGICPAMNEEGKAGWSGAQDGRRGGSPLNRIVLDTFEGFSSLREQDRDGHHMHLMSTHLSAYLVQ
jgi:hypothetical protein